MTIFQFLHYNKSNKEYARSNRNNPTRAEKKIREEILRKKKTGYIFLRQKMIDSFIIDFYCAKLLLGIEIDGDIHQKSKSYDEIRTNLLQKHGIRIIRYSNEEVYKNIGAIYTDIMEEIAKRERQL